MKNIWLSVIQFVLITTEFAASLLLDWLAPVYSTITSFSNGLKEKALWPKGNLVDLRSLCFGFESGGMDLNHRERDLDAFLDTSTVKDDPKATWC